MPDKRRFQLIGIVFGVLMVEIYILISISINSLFLPGIPLAALKNNPLTQVLGYAILGVLVGFTSTWSEYTLFSSFLGGMISAVWMVIMTVFSGFDFLSIGGGAYILLLYWFIPLTILLTPVSLLVRVGVNFLTHPNRSLSWWRRLGVPIAVLLLALILGCFTLYPSQARDDIRYTHAMIQDSLKAGDRSAYPKPLQSVSGFPQDAEGTPYTLEYIANTDIGKKQMYIIARFENGYALTCVFMENMQVPECISGALR
jgi:hypothetical protein